jgi:signal transduction histidine kinase
LRNLFGIVASAGHLLEADPEDRQRATLLDAIEMAALRGGQLTSDLLARTRRQPSGLAVVDVNARLGNLAPMIRALAGRALVRIERRPGRLPARLDADAFDAAILELVTNARKALSTGNSVRIRARGAGHRIWISILDDGDGMTSEMLARALGERPSGTRGNGLGRVQAFVSSAHGRMRIRSRKGRGTVASISLPTLLRAAPVARHATESNLFGTKEKHDEERQPAAA